MADIMEEMNSIVHEQSRASIMEGDDRFVVNRENQMNNCVPMPMLVESNAIQAQQGQSRPYSNLANVGYQSGETVNDLLERYMQSEQGQQQQNFVKKPIPT